jgi:hypothetical protein
MKGHDILGGMPAHQTKYVKKGAGQSSIVKILLNIISNN